jgi:hypothetical protein
MGAALRTRCRWLGRTPFEADESNAWDGMHGEMCALQICFAQCGSMHHPTDHHRVGNRALDTHGHAAGACVSVCAAF